jgi:dihydroorotate dehydrogenase
MDAADLDLIAAVSAAITIPLAVKLSPYYSAFANFARQAVGAARTAWSCSTASTSPTSTSRASTWSRRWS